MKNATAAKIKKANFTDDVIYVRNTKIDKLMPFPEDENIKVSHLLNGLPSNSLELQILTEGYQNVNVPSGKLGHDFEFLF